MLIVFILCIPKKQLDLSYNRLLVIPQNVTDIKRIKGAIDLQGNPLVCNCTTQWLLDELVTQLYGVPEQQKYLLNLRYVYSILVCILCLNNFLDIFSNPG